ncbi:MAG: carboxypeptidase regulatory-like domain-containing protein, partial [Nevskiales bacterium]
VLCGLGDAAAVRAPGVGEPVALSIDAGHCAAYWPAQSGWHVLQSAGASWPFYIRAADDGAALRAARDRQATQWLVQIRPTELPAVAPHAVPLPRWSFLLAWLLMAFAVWWSERGNWIAGHGRPVRP